MKKIEITSLESEQVYHNNWKRCVGSGNISLALRGDYERSLELVQREIGFDYIRAHGIFSDVLAVYREDTSGNPIYNFTYLDQAYDTLLRHNIRPIVELGFTPDALRSGPEQIFYWKANITPPASYPKWNALVRALIEHLLARYGRNEVLSWPFEVWNEPNFEEFWARPNLDDYFIMWKETYRTLKSAEPRLIVGGPAADTNGDEFLEAFLLRCAAESLRPDFISRHVYLSLTPRPTQEFDYQDFLPVEFLLDKLRGTRERLARTGFAQTPLYVTEWNSSYTPRNPIHDTVQNAVLLARALSEGGDFADILSYWTFCDVFEELGIPRSQLHGGFGLLGYGQLRKPMFHLFRFFSRLQKTLLERWDSGILTSDGAARCTAVLWNSGTQEAPLSITLPEPGGGKAWFFMREELSGQSGDVYGAWRHMGAPRYPTQEEQALLHRAAQTHVTTLRTTSQLTVTVTPNCILLLEGRAVAETSGDYSSFTADDNYFFPLSMRTSY